MAVGISFSTRHAQTFYFDQKDTPSFSYYCDGRIFDRHGFESFPPHQREGFGSGDVITTHLDLNYGTIGFSKNGRFLGIAYKDINCQRDYRVSVRTFCDNERFEFLSYRHINADADTLKEANRINRVLEEEKQALLVGAENANQELVVKQRRSEKHIGEIQELMVKNKELEQELQEMKISMHKKDKASRDTIERLEQEQRDLSEVNGCTTCFLL